eukprot:m51a1_g5136 putative protein set-like (259) ;mRNA; f:4302-5511
MAQPEKRARHEVEEEDTGDDVDPALRPMVEKLQEAQAQLDALDQEEAEATRRLQHEFDERRKPVYGGRNEIIRTIPGFWARAIKNHDLSEYLTEEDNKAIEYLAELSFEEDEARALFTFVFKANPFFENETLTKEYRYKEGNEEQLEVVPCSIHWKSGQNLTQRKHGAPVSGGKRSREPKPSFFEWFEQTTVSDTEITELIKELWAEPLKYFLCLESAAEDDEEVVVEDDGEQDGSSGSEGEEGDGDDDEGDGGEDDA